MKKLMYSIVVAGLLLSNNGVYAETKQQCIDRYQKEFADCADNVLKKAVRNDMLSCLLGAYLVPSVSACLLGVLTATIDQCLNIIECHEQYTENVEKNCPNE